MKTVLLHIGDDTGLDNRVEAACDIVRATQGHLRCVQISAPIDFVAVDPYGGAALAPAIIAEQDRVNAQVRAHVEAKLAREGISWDWRHLKGETVRELLSAAALSDVLVVTLPRTPRHDYRDPQPIAADLTLAGRIPVMAVPQNSRALDLEGAAMIAWDGSQEASRALSLALPLLRLSEDVHVVTVEEAGKNAFPATEAPEYLSRYGIKSQLHVWPQNGQAVDVALNAAIDEIEPRWMVMGAFGHHRLREFVLGGVTRTMLREARLPLLLAH